MSIEPDRESLDGAAGAHLRLLYELSTHELYTLQWLARSGRRSRPCTVGVDAPRLEQLGLVEFSHETRSGTTHWRATEMGLRVSDAAACTPLYP